MLEKLTIKKKILWLIFTVITATVIAYTALSIYFTEKAKEEGIDLLLFSVAYGAQNIVGETYHNDIIDSTSVNQEEYDKIVNALSRFAQTLEVKEIYSYINFNGELRWTSGSLADDTFFSKYDGNTEKVQKIYFKPFLDNKPLIYEYEDFYGSVRSVFIPFTTKNGKQYIIGVDYPTEHIKKIEIATILLYTGIGFILLTIALTIAFIPINQISKPLQHLVKFTNELVNHDFHIPETNLNNLYLISSKSSDEVGQLSEAFLTMQFSLSQYIIDLRNTTIAKESMEGQLRIANAIQMNMTPKKFHTLPDNKIFNIYGTMLPAKEVGGDLFNFFMIDDEHLGFTIGDVSDKGIPAALFMAMTNTLIKAIALSGLSPAEVLYKANNELCKENDQCMFVTLVFGILNTKTGAVEFANAGHNPFIVMKSDCSAEYKKMSPGMVLAAFENITFTNEQFTLNLNDTIFLYTDGVTEAMNKQHILFGEHRLLEIVGELGELPLPDLINSTLNRLDSFVDGYEQSDDITILALRFLASQQLN